MDSDREIIEKMYDGDVEMVQGYAISKRKDLYWIGSMNYGTTLEETLRFLSLL